MDNGVKYIEKISSMYDIDDSVKADLLSIVDKIDEQLAPWCWDDIDYAIDVYYTKKSDRNYPKVVQVRAILNANRHEKRSNFIGQSDFNEKGITTPYTNIRAIQDVFLTVCRLAHQKGILYDEFCAVKENIPYGNRMIVKDGKLYNLRWEWDDMVEYSKKRFPDVFGKFKNLTAMEEYAFAYKLGVLK